MRNLLAPGMVLADIQEVLDQGCENPDCKNDKCKDEIFLNARCHPDSAVRVAIYRGDDRVHVLCHECEKVVAHIKISKE